MNIQEAYMRDVKYSVAGMGTRQSQAYQADGGANDEGWDKQKPNYDFPNTPVDEPHAVVINGRKWKTFGSKAHATNVAKKINGATVVKESDEKYTPLDSIQEAYINTLAESELNK